MSAIEQELQERILLMAEDCSRKGGLQGFHNVSASCTTLLNDIFEEYADIGRALEGLQRAPESLRVDLANGLAFVIGHSQYTEVESNRRYHEGIAFLARKYPRFLTSVLEYAQKAEGNSRLSGYSSQRPPFVDNPEKLGDTVLGSLLAQPMATLHEIHPLWLPKNLILLDEYVRIARQVDPYGLKAVVNYCSDFFTQHPLDLGASHGDGLALRRLIFEGHAITIDECNTRISAAGLALFGGSLNNYSPARLKMDLEAVSHAPDYMEHCFIHDLYAALQREGEDYSLMDPCDENFTPATIDVHRQYAQILKRFFEKQCIDYRMKLAPWVLGHSTFGASLHIRQKHCNDDLWLEREAITAAAHWLDTSLNPDSPGRIQSRRYGWISTLTENECIRLSQSEGQLMACYKATGYSALVRHIKSERYHEDILASDMGL
jgi:hypothetical protein